MRADHNQRAVNKFTSEDQFFAAIGRFIFEFSQLEYTIKHHIAETVDLQDQYFNAIMTHDFALLCTIAESVLGPRVAEQKAADFKKLIAKCRSLNTDRVRIAHGLWFVGGGRGALHHVSRQKLKEDTHFEEANDIANKADLAANLRSEFEEIMYYVPFKVK